MARSRRSSARLAGFAVGVPAGFLLAEFPTFGLVVALAFVAGALISKDRLEALGGLLVGLSATWLLVIGLATARCAAFDAEPGQECVMADLGPWGLVAVATLLVGAAVSIVAARR